jgi:hypothetical protein
MKNIVIFSNCAGSILTNMFKRHYYTKDKYNIDYITNYEYLVKPKFELSHIELLKTCDIFIYQILNKSYPESEYNIPNMINKLRKNCIVLKVNYYRFKGFWYETEYKPYHKFKKILFLNEPHYGIHNSFINFNTTDKNNVIEKIDNIQISKDEIVSYFNNNLQKFKNLDNGSDVCMFDYFLKNYKTKHLFHDPFHPTNLFFYQIFRQLIQKIENYDLISEDIDFINLLNDKEMVYFALPILPIIKKHLELELSDFIYVYSNNSKQFYMNVYDYYYIRLSKYNFMTYLNEKKTQNQESINA